MGRRRPATRWRAGRLDRTPRRWQVRSSWPSGSRAKQSVSTPCWRNPNPPRNSGSWLNGSSAKGGEVTVRDVQQGRRQVESADEAEGLLKDLVEGGYGNWCRIPTSSSGGRPIVFRLANGSTSTEPPRSGDLGGCVDVDASGNAETVTRTSESTDYLAI